MAQEQVSKIEYWEGKIAREIFASLEEKKNSFYNHFIVPLSHIPLVKVRWRQCKGLTLIKA